MINESTKTICNVLRVCLTVTWMWFEWAMIEGRSGFELLRSFWLPEFLPTDDGFAITMSTRFNHWTKSIHDWLQKKMEKHIYFKLFKNLRLLNFYVRRSNKTKQTKKNYQVNLSNKKRLTWIFDLLRFFNSWVA